MSVLNVLIIFVKCLQIMCANYCELFKLRLVKVGALAWCSLYSVKICVIFGVRGVRFERRKVD